MGNLLKYAKIAFGAAESDSVPCYVRVRPSHFGSETSPACAGQRLLVRNGLFAHLPTLFSGDEKIVPQTYKNVNWPDVDVSRHQIRRSPPAVSSYTV
jgi:hypothetical protein